jgi:hypothetical protein
MRKLHRRERKVGAEECAELRVPGDLIVFETSVALTVISLRFILASNFCPSPVSRMYDCRKSPASLGGARSLLSRPASVSFDTASLARVSTNERQNRAYLQSVLMCGRNDVAVGQERRGVGGHLRARESVIWAKQKIPRRSNGDRNEDTYNEGREELGSLHIQRVQVHTGGIGELDQARALAVALQQAQGGLPAQANQRRERAVGGTAKELQSESLCTQKRSAVMA